MKISITGHTGGLGLAIHKHFDNDSNQILGFSRSNGYNITNASDRARIVSESIDSDIFINNAYNYYDTSQLELLKMMFNAWKGDSKKLIVNLSTRHTTDLSKAYCLTKKAADNFCESVVYQAPHILNLKPGLTDTDVTKNIPGDRMSTDDVVYILDMAISHRNRFKFHNISFGL